MTPLFGYLCAGFALVALIRAVILRRRVDELELVLSQRWDRKAVAAAVDRLEDGPTPDPNLLFPREVLGVESEQLPERWTRWGTP